jgi:hypothetical protein
MNAELIAAEPQETSLSRWEYKTIVYSIEGKYFYSLRFWADSKGKVYGPRERAKLIGGIARQMRQLEQALKELDQEGWELVSVSTWMVFLATKHGTAVLRRPLANG